MKITLGSGDPLKLSTDLLEGGAELLLTELKDEELLKLVALDITKALKET